MPQLRRGTSLAGAVCVISIALLAALTVGTSASLQTQLVQHSENVQIASLLADSALQQGIAELMRAPGWGTNNERIEFAGPVDRSRVLLTFDKNAGVPFSTNNPTGSPLLGWSGSRLLSQHQVPEHRVHLVAVAECRNARRLREALVYVPNYTVSLASTGKVHLTNSVVGSLKNVQDLNEVDAHPELLGPGDLATNSDLGDSVVLSQASRVTGNVQSRGDVSLDSGSSVGGEVRQHHSETELPHFNFDEYDPARSNPNDPGTGPPLHYEELSPGGHGAQNLVGLVRCEGSVTFTDDLHLDNCLLYVTGDLRVRGGIRGTGAVIVKGRTTVEGGASLTSDDNVALLSRGDVSLLGTQGHPYQFQGLVYTRGNFMARYFTVVGGFVADGSVPGTGNVDLHGSRFYRAAMATHSDFYVPYQQTLQFASTINEPKQVEIPVGGGNRFHYGNTPVTPGEPPDDPPPDPAGYDTPAKAIGYPNGNGEWSWWNPVFLQISREHVNGQEQYVYRLFYNGAAEPTFTSRQALIDRIDELHRLKCPGYHDGKDANGDPYPIEPPTVTVRNYGGVVGPDPGFLDLQVGAPNPLEGLRKETSPYIKRAWALKLDIWEKRNEIQVAGAAHFNFSFDPNRFLKESDKVRLSAVTEY